jgi:hypothetical protein
MKRVSFLLTGIVASTVFAGAVLAQSTTTSVGSCKDVQWKAEVLKKYPDISKACVDVVSRDGVKYVKVSGHVRLKGNGVVTVRLDHTDSDIAWKPGAGDTVQIDGKAVKATDVVVDQHLRFYMPVDRVAVVDISDTAVTPREVQVEVK